MKSLVKAVSINEQYRAIRRKHNHFNCKLRRNTLTVEGLVRPTARSEIYTFVLHYRLNDNPSVRITSPQLRKNNDGHNIPHMYLQKRLCLHQPKYKQFQKSDFLTETIIPWISLWLYYYEQWHITGKWLGGGEHPT